MKKSKDEHIQISGAEYSIANLRGANDSVFVKKMIHLFIEVSQKFISEMNLALLEKDLVQINHLAHRIKPSIDIMQILSIKQTVRDIEQAKTINRELDIQIAFMLEKLNDIIVHMKGNYE